MRKWLYAGAAIIALAAAVLLLPGLTGGTQVAAQQTGTTALIEKTSLTTTVDSTGTVVPAQSTYLTFGTSGKLKTIAAKVGDQVKTGQVLGNLDTADLEYQVALAEQQLAVEQANYDALIAPPTEKQLTQAKANLASAKSQLATAQASANTANDSITSSCADLDSKKTTLDTAQTSYNDYLKDGYKVDATFLPDPDASASKTLRDAQKAFDVAQANCNSTKVSSDNTVKVASAQAAVDEAQAALDALMAGPSKTDIAVKEATLKQKKLQLDNAKKALENAQIVAPFDGVVTSVPVVVGQLMNTQTTAVAVADMSALYVDIDVDEQYISQVKLGQEASVTLNAIAGKALATSVYRISPSGTSTSGVVTYSVRLAFKQAESGVMPGMTGDVTLVVGQLNDVLVVPTQAIQRDTNGEYITVVVGSNNQRVAVTSGKTQNGKTVITGNGISAGQTVLLTARTASSGSAFPGPGGGQ